MAGSWSTTGLWERESAYCGLPTRQQQQRSRLLLLALLSITTYKNKYKKTEREIKGLIFCLSFFVNGDSDGVLKCRTVAWSGRVGSGPVDKW